MNTPTPFKGEYLSSFFKVSRSSIKVFLENPVETNRTNITSKQVFSKN